MNNSRLFSFLSLAFLLSCVGSMVMCMDQEPTFSKKASKAFGMCSQTRSSDITLLLFAASHLTEGFIEKHLDENNSARKITKRICLAAKDSGAINTALYFSGNSNKKIMGNLMPIANNVALQYASDKIDLIKSLSEKTRYNELPDWSKRIMRVGAAHGLWLLEQAVYNYLFCSNDSK